MSERPLKGRIALVTGATRGIGNAAALALADAGAHIIAVGQTQGALEELDDTIRSRGLDPATIVPMDLSDVGGTDQLGYAISQRHGRLDILVHAAAMMGGLRPVAHIPPALWSKIIATNLTSVYGLIRSLEPLLRAGDSSRAIFLTSGAAQRPRAFWGSYSATKAALEALVRCWADEVENSSIRAILLNPGGMRTKMRAEAFPGEDKEALPLPSEIGPLIVELAGCADPGLPDKVVSFADWRSVRRAASPGIS